MTPASELPIDTVAEAADPAAMAMAMANAIFGDGVNVLNASYTGDPDSAGIYRDGDSIAPNTTPSDTGVILSTGNAESFTNSSGQANQDQDTSTNTSGPNRHPDFDAAAGARTYDAAFLDIDFEPTGEWLAMEFVFSSEEYPEFINSIYQDFVAVWINGVEVEIEVGDGNIGPGNINPADSPNLYVDNTQDAVNSEMDGLTITLALSIPVNPGEVNSIRIGIADVADNRYDSNLLIAADSMQTDLVALADEFNVYPDGSKIVDVLQNDVNDSGGALTITQINGVDVVAGDSVVLKTGQTVTLNADGTLTLTGDGDAEDYSFTYAVDNGLNTDTGIVNVGSIPCFVAGTMIATPDGERAVETLQPGDLVLTHDDGPQPLRWIGKRTLRAEKEYAPIRIEADTFGRHNALVVSPEHRILLRDSFAELFFGEREVLVAAKYLLNDRTVRRRVGGIVTYVHMMFDQHQVVYSEGLPTESFLPGPQTKDVFEQEVLREICRIFPELDQNTGAGYSPAARRTLRRFEADLWRNAIHAA